MDSSSLVAAAAKAALAAEVLAHRPDVTVGHDLVDVTPCGHHKRWAITFRATDRVAGMQVNVSLDNALEVAALIAAVLDHPPSYRRDARWTDVAPV